MEFSNEFKVTYYIEKKPNGKRSYYVRTGTFESVFNEFVLKDLCEKVHDHDFLFGIQNDLDDVVLEENDYGVVYKVVFRDGKKVLETYIVEIDLVFNGGAYNPNYKRDNYDDDKIEEYTPEYEQYRSDKWEKERQFKYEKWFLEISDWQISDLLEKLEEGCSLELIKKMKLSLDEIYETSDKNEKLEHEKEIEKEFNDALNFCLKKGFVKNGKLVKSIFRKEYLEKMRPGSLNDLY